MKLKKCVRKITTPRKNNTYLSLALEYWGVPWRRFKPRFFPRVTAAKFSAGNRGFFVFLPSFLIKTSY
jgi:hypothetical protein